MEIIKLIRPQQWVKNLFVFLPLFFSGQLFNVLCWKQALIAFLSFSLMASVIYCYNDIHDVEADRVHPQKRFRPLASGKVSIKTAYMMMILLFIGSLAAGWALGTRRASVIGILVLYLCLNIAYCIKLKQLAIVDVFIISIGFVLRLVSGGLACDIWLSPWIVSMTFLLALFLAFAKRRDDVVLHEEKGIIARRNIVSYNLPFMNQVLGLIGAITMVCYIIYTVSSEVEQRMGSQYVYTTSVFVLAGILRYLQVTIVDVHSGSPTRILLHDHFIQACVVMWVLSYVVIIYM